MCSPIISPISLDDTLQMHDKKKLKWTKLNHAVVWRLSSLTLHNKVIFCTLLFWGLFAAKSYWRLIYSFSRLAAGVVPYFGLYYGFRVYRIPHVPHASLAKPIPIATVGFS